MDKDPKKKVMEYQILSEKIKQLQTQFEAVEQQLEEITSIIQSFDEFAQLKDKTEILVPINNGIFAKAHLIKEDHLLVNVGANVIVDKPIPDAKKLIQNQQEELTGLRTKIISTLEIMTSRASQIENELKNV